MTPRQELDSFIDRYTPDVAKMARAAFAWMRRKYPAATVLVYDNYNALAIGFGPSDKTSEAIFSIALFPRWMSLFFLHGARLADPEKRLKGGGSQARHVVLDRIEILEDPAIAALMNQACEGCGAREAGRGEIVIKSISAKQRPRRPA